MLTVKYTTKSVRFFLQLIHNILMYCMQLVSAVNLSKHVSSPFFNQENRMKKNQESFNFVSCLASSMTSDW